MTQSPIPGRLTPPESRDPMMTATPAKPATSPAMPRGRTRSPRTSQPSAATRSGIDEAMIAASEASIHCIATKFSPR